MSDGEIQAVLSRSIIEETDTTVRLHKGQEYPSGILPKVGGQQYRSVRVGASSVVKGSVVGKDIVVEKAEAINLSKNVMAPGTEIQGSINSLGDVEVGTGSWIQGGIQALGDIVINPYLTNSETPGHVLVDGAVCGKNVRIAKGVVILGPVIASESIEIDDIVTVRDHVSAPIVKIGNGCLIGGLQAGNSLSIGEFNTIASSQILIPGNLSQVDCKYPIRSPYPNCNSCPYDEEFSGSNEIARKLSCHNFAKLSEEKVSAGKCTDWVSFPINDPSNHYNFSDFTCVSLIPKDSVNIRLYAEKSTIWERGGE